MLFFVVLGPEPLYGPMSPGVFLWRLQTWQLSRLSKEDAGEAHDSWSFVGVGTRRRQQDGQVEGVYVKSRSWLCSSTGWAWKRGHCSMKWCTVSSVVLHQG